MPRPPSPATWPPVGARRWAAAVAVGVFVPLSAVDYLAACWREVLVGVVAMAGARWDAAVRTPTARAWLSGLRSRSGTSGRR